MRRRKLLAVCLSALFAPASVACGDSLWARRSRTRAYLFYDSPMYEVGDILTVLVNQSTDVNNRETRNLKKDASASAGVDGSTTTGGGLGDQGADGKVDLSGTSNRQFDGEAGFRSAQGFTDKITVTVRELLPNGNLLIGGGRRVLVDGDERSLLISGMVRRQDIRPDGTVDSNIIADLRIRYVGTGENQHFVRQGWFSHRWNRLWPF